METLDKINLEKMDIFKNFEFVQKQEEEKIFITNNWYKISERMKTIESGNSLSCGMTNFDIEKLCSLNKAEYHKLAMSIIRLYFNLKETELKTALFTMDEEDQLILTGLIESHKNKEAKGNKGSVKF